VVASVLLSAVNSRACSVREKVTDNRHVHTGDGNESDGGSRECGRQPRTPEPVRTDCSDQECSDCVSGNDERVHSYRHGNVAVKQRIGSSSAATPRALPSGKGENWARRKHRRAVRVVTGEEHSGASMQSDNAGGRTRDHDASRGVLTKYWHLRSPSSEFTPYYRRAISIRLLNFR
jgi:hypothetical protein